MHFFQNALLNSFKNGKLFPKGNFDFYQSKSNLILFKKAKFC
jgi:hypothetical protein